LRLFADIRTAPVPFFIRPVTSQISGSIKTEFLDPNFDTHFAFIEEQLTTSGGQYLCGDKLADADIMMGYCTISFNSLSRVTPTFFLLWQ
jgi:glutathione S-transferase